jgi:hypothetical protein
MNPITEEVNVAGGGLDFETIKKIAAEQSRNGDRRDSKIDWLEDCDGTDAQCMTFEGTSFEDTDVTDFFEPAEMSKVSLPINDSGRAVLEIKEGNSTATWEFNIPNNPGLPIYIAIYAHDNYFAVTELEDGKVTYTETPVESQSPEQSEALRQLIDYKTDSLFERPFKWLELQASHRAYTTAKSKANTRTCQVFGSNCAGTASYSRIASAYKAAYDDIITPAEYDLFTNSDDKNVRKAELMLSKTYDQLKDCYWRTYRAADSSSSSEYDATTTCWSDVKSLENDLDIFLSDFNVTLSEFTVIGDH